MAVAPQRRRISSLRVGPMSLRVTSGHLEGNSQALEEAVFTLAGSLQASVTHEDRELPLVTVMETDTSQSYNGSTGPAAAHAQVPLPPQSILTCDPDTKALGPLARHRIDYARRSTVKCPSSYTEEGAGRARREPQPAGPRLRG